MMPSLFKRIGSKHANIRAHLTILLACALAMLAAGCASTKQTEKPTHVRGWIGGNYDVVKRFPKSLTPRPKAGLLIVALSTNTPVYAAGLRTGDVIVQLDHGPIGHIKDFHRKIDALEPGASLSLTAWRDGQLLEPNVTVGRETFRYNGSVAFGIFLNFPDGLNLWPTHEDPRFSLVVLGCDFSSGKRRAEIDSVRNAYQRKCNAKNTVEPVDGDYRYWFVIAQVEKHETILKQEMAGK